MGSFLYLQPSQQACRALEGTMKSIRLLNPKPERRSACSAVAPLGRFGRQKGFWKDSARADEGSGSGEKG